MHGSRLSAVRACLGFAGILVLLAEPALAQSSTFRFQGFLSAREISVRSQPSWLEGGDGRFDVGASNSTGRAQRNVLSGQLGMDWTPSSWFVLHADGVARREPSGSKGRRAGLVQAYVDVVSEHLRLRGGMFWLPTSRENVDPLWTSPYAITYSTLNTWIGEEVRPVGADLQYSPNFYIKVGATAFRGLTTMGTMLAERGWSLGNRLSVYDEKLPTPIGEITRPVGGGLSGKTGYSERLRFQLPERAMLQITHVDNHAPIVRQFDGYEPWATRFNVVGGELGSTSATTLASEWASGSTSAYGGSAPFTIDFRTLYVLLSQKSGANRWTARVERYASGSRKRPSGREHGDAWTLAWLRDVTGRVRLGAEYVHATADRPANAVAAGVNPIAGGSTIQAELRYAFGQP